MPVVVVRGGDLFKSQAQTLVNAVNCVGVMGKGIALEFKKRFPAMYSDYVERCRSGRMQPGRPYLYMPEERAAKWILNFPTKHHWRDQSSFIDIIAGLMYLEDLHKIWGVKSLAVPALGTGLGGLEWKEVEAIMVNHFKYYGIPVEIYKPFVQPGRDIINSKKSVNGGKSRIDQISEGGKAI